MTRLLATIGLLVLPVQCLAHEVHASTRAELTTILTLTYANGKPFAFEQFEVTPAGAEVPSQVGRTDAQGRAAILPAPGKALEFVATTKDGHGARLNLAPATEAATGGSSEEIPRWLAATAGGGIIFGLFGLFQLFANRKRRTGA